MRLLAVPALVLLLAPATASAARVEMRCDPLVPAIDCPVAPLTVTAAPGEPNVIELSRDATGVIVRDTRTPPVAGPGCEPAEPSAVRCAATGRFDVVVDAGDLDDGVDAAHLDSVGEVALDGGAGDDRVVGTPGRDVLDGGDGRDVLLGGDGDDFLTGDPADAVAPDTLDGGPGRDTAGYEERTLRLTVDLRDPAPDGSPGEGDLLQAIEGVTGGSGDTVLRGDEGPNSLRAPFGNRGVVSRVSGFGGDDRLTGRRVDGGPGDDVLSARVRARCGPGTDRIFDPRLLAPPPRGDCEAVDLDGLIVDVRTLRISRRSVRLDVELTEPRAGVLLVRAGGRTVGRRRAPRRPATVAVATRRRGRVFLYDPAARGVPTRGFFLRAST